MFAMSQRRLLFLIAYLFVPSASSFRIVGFSPPTAASRGAVRPQRGAALSSQLHASRGTDLAVSSITPKGQGSVVDCDSIPRRKSIERIVSVAGLALASSAAAGSPAALATEAGASSETGSSKKEFADYSSKRDKFSIGLPTNFKVITKIGSPRMIDGKGEQLFSALDLNSGAVITVHRERACPISDYVSQPKRCDLILPKDAPLLSAETMQKDASKILRRHDDRDNAVLGGTSSLQSAEMVKGRDGLYILANTVLPTGGTYEDEMGLRKESTLTRVVKARVVSQSEREGDGESLLGVWVSAPLDEWQKPSMGTKLNQIVDSVQIEGGRLQ